MSQNSKLEPWNLILNSRKHRGLSFESRLTVSLFLISTVCTYSVWNKPSLLSDNSLSLNSCFEKQTPLRSQLLINLGYHYHELLCTYRDGAARGGGGTGRGCTPPPPISSKNKFSGKQAADPIAASTTGTCFSAPLPPPPLNFHSAVPELMCILFPRILQTRCLCCLISLRSRILISQFHQANWRA